MKTSTSTSASEAKLVKSPTHIFDSNVYAQWTELEKEKLDLAKNEKSNNNNNNSNTNKDSEEKEPSCDIALGGDQTFSIEYDQGIFAMKWSPDGQYLAVGCADGGVRVLRGSDGKLEHKLATSGSQPVTSLRWKPSLSNVGSSSCLITTSSSGCIDIWHVQSAKCMYSINEEGNQIFCFDLSPSMQGSFKFATAGKDRTIRIYDDETKKLTCSLEKGFMSKQVGHSNRIFSLKWKPDDPNILLSGGWDNSVLFWDLRSKSCFRSIFGPHIAGQTIDIQNDIVVTGSWAIRDTINLYEFSTGRQIKKQTISWDPSPMIYSLSYSPTLEGVIAAGGSGLNCARIINTNTGQKSSTIRLTNGAGVYCLDWEPKGNLLAVAGNSPDISLVTIQ